MFVYKILENYLKLILHIVILLSIVRMAEELVKYVAPGLRAPSLAVEMGGEEELEKKIEPESKESVALQHVLCSVFTEKVTMDTGRVLLYHAPVLRIPKVPPEFPSHTDLA